MTDTSYPVTAITGRDFSPASLLSKEPVIDHPRHGGPILDGVQEDDGQISCICGYFDDDGWTVACDSCNRWQHQLCYYPQWEDQSLPEDLQHYCVDCHPRPFDRQGARARQKVKREEQDSLVNGLKRQAPKSHKKKVKEPGYTNGWPLDKSRHDRNSASPRDQPPPSKRPKTSHRTSESVGNASVKGHARKRTATNINHRRSLSRSPDSPINFYSEEFMRCYLEDQWSVTHANLHNSIAVTNALSEWLSAPDDLFRDMHGLEKREVLNRWDGELDDIPGKAQIEIQEQHDGRVKDEENNFPTWKIVTVKESVANGAYIGELKGHVGFKEEYQEDPSNRWSLLRHPEPFVFFHPRLPIYIDARNEGTELRYLRRSCMPNAKLQILVTDQTDYRFCFMATQQIDPGMEVAVGWDTSDGLPELMRRGQNGPSVGDLHQLSSWVSTVLASCGPCACQSHDCRMSRFDRRGEMPSYEDEAQPVKMPKAKKKKAGQHISPLNTQVNSRSGSEARKVDPDDEPSDSRSASGSAGRGPASRDITPNTHYSHTGSLSAIPELSERERKKLAKEEEMFRRQEEERHGKTGKKKRNSGGSALNTPSATSSKQFGFPTSSKYTDASTPKQTNLPSAKPGRRPKSLSTLKTPPKVITRTVKRPRPEYVHAEVQCDMDQEEAEKRRLNAPPRRPIVTVRQRLLERCALNNARRKAPTPVAKATQEVKVDDKMDVDRSSDALSPAKASVLEAADPVLRPDPSKDTDMKDAGSGDRPLSPVPVEANQRHQTSSPTNPDAPSQQFMDPPAPPWPSQVAHSAPEAPAPQSQPHKPPDMHIQMPPPPSNPFSGPAPLSATSDNTLTPTVTASPVTLAGPGPVFSPSVTAAVTPSPARKKMSLSDYTKARKAVKDQETEAKAERESSPASVASGSAAPALNASSSEVARTMDSGSAVVEEDVKMEDAGDKA